MIRPAILDDMGRLTTVVEASGLFPPEGLAEIDRMLTDYFAGKLGKDHCWITDDDGSGPVGVAYYAPERMTDGTWNLYMLIVHPDHQGEGRGTALVRYVEEALQERGERVLLVETSGLASFEATRTFYRKCGFEEEARIREFYQAGEDKIVFCKAVSRENNRSRATSRLIDSH